MYTIRHMVDRLPVYWQFKRAILGSFSLTTPTERYILNEFAINHNGETETPGHHFSQALKEVRFRKRSIIGHNLSYPYKAIPGAVPYAFYLDISSAYAQIADVFGLEVTFTEGRYIAYGDTLVPEICHREKICRALLVSGTGKLSHYTEWKNETLNNRQFYNRNYAPYLRYAIIATLHAVQSQLDRYTIYAHTDGFICPSWHIKKACKLLDQYGFHYRIKAEGITRINGVGSYSIGNISTRNHYSQKTERRNIRSDFSEWWLNVYGRGITLRNNC